MPLANNVPILLDNQSGWNEAQQEQINIIVKTTRRYMEAKAKQKQLPPPVITNPINKKYGRILDVRAYLYKDTMSVSFILDPVGFVAKGKYPLFETKYKIDNAMLQGSNDTFHCDEPLSNLGRVVLKKVEDNIQVLFERNEMTWPVDSYGNMVKYSCYFRGNTYAK